ncbi:MAG TPA: type II secretion system ATPase GspE [Armatimonadota bacterium]|nr:type II secretion system ATPase GspE [Armatimonadota bacterium]
MTDHSAGSPVEPAIRILLKDGLLSEADLEKAQTDAERAGQPVRVSLVKLGLITNRQMQEAVGQSLGIATIDLREVSLDPEVIATIPAELAQRHQIVPLEVNNGVVTVAMADPLNLEALDDVRMVTGKEVRALLADAGEVLRVVENAYMQEMMAEGEADVELVSSEEIDPSDLERMAKEALVIRLVNTVIRQAVTDKASDIHVEPFENEIKLRYRIDGVLNDQPSPAQRLLPAIVSRIKILSNLNIAEHRLPQDGRIALMVTGREVDIRVSIIPTLYGEAVVLRLLDQSQLAFELDELGMQNEQLEQYVNVIQKHHGVVLATGPTGCGKTTTLYAALRRIYSPRKKIITIEDPVEYRLEGVNQIHVNNKIGLSFASGLRSIVRHDPDIVMVGEIRDKDTANIAINAALTGHLVFSTLHTNGAPGAITRMQDMGVEPYLIASSLEGVLAQRLVRTICHECREEYEPSAEWLATIHRELEIDPPGTLVRGTGCASCRYTGYQGRTAIYEVLPLNEHIRSMIIRRASAGEIKREAVIHGMAPMRQDGWLKVLAGDTTIEEILAVTQIEE